MQIIRWVVSCQRRVANGLSLRTRNQSATLHCCVQLSCQRLLSRRKLCNFIWRPSTRRKLCNFICQRLLSRCTLCNFIWRPFTRRKLCNFIWRPFTRRKLWIRKWNQSATLHCCVRLSCQRLWSRRKLCNFTWRPFTIRKLCNFTWRPFPNGLWRRTRKIGEFAPWCAIVVPTII